MVINTNTASMFSMRTLEKNTSALDRSLGKLSSGSRIVSPEDDAAGLAVSMKFQSEIRRTDAARSNSGNAISFSQTQDGFLDTVNLALRRMSELSVLARDETKSASDRLMYDREFQELRDFIKRTKTKEFNGNKLFDGTALKVVDDSTGSSYSMNAVSLDADDYKPVLADDVWTLSRDLWKVSKDGYVTKVDLWKDAKGNFHLTDPGGGAVKHALGSFLAKKPPIVHPDALGRFSFAGDANDETQNGDNATVSNSTLVTDRHGNTNGAYKTNGTSSSRLTWGSGVADKWFKNRTTLTVSLWIKPEVAESDKKLFFEYSSSRFGLEGRTGSGQVVEFWTNNHTGSKLTASLDVGSWNHVVLMIDGTTKKFFKNGSLAASVAYSSAITGSGGVGMGGRGGSSDNTNSTFDDLRVYNRALTDTEISSLYQNNEVPYDGTNAATAGTQVAVDPIASGEDTAAAKIAKGTKVYEDPTAVDPTAIKDEAANIKSTAAATSATSALDKAITQAASDRANVGANISRLRMVDSQLAVYSEKLSEANSRIVDVDIALETAIYSRNQILVQAATAMLAQANLMPQMALRLLA